MTDNIRFCRAHRPTGVLTYLQIPCRCWGGNLAGSQDTKHSLALRPRNKILLLIFSQGGGSMFSPNPHIIARRRWINTSPRLEHAWVTIPQPSMRCNSTSQQWRDTRDCGPHHGARLKGPRQKRPCAVWLRLQDIPERAKLQGEKKGSAFRTVGWRERERFDFEEARRTHGMTEVLCVHGGISSHNSKPLSKLTNCVFLNKHDQKMKKGKLSQEEVCEKIKTIV